MEITDAGDAAKNKEKCELPKKQKMRQVLFIVPVTVP